MENLNKIEQVELHSEEVEEIMSKIPSWIIRWGISVIAGVLVLLFVGSYYFRYPKYVSLPVEIINSKHINETAIGYMNINPSYITKVKVGQDVRVSLVEYPEADYGYLMGKVSSISYEPNKNGTYSATIRFPKGIRTNYSTIKSPLKVINGNAEVIISNDRLIDNFISPLKKAVSISSQ